MRDTSNCARAQDASASSPITFRSSAKKYANETPKQQADHRDIAKKYAQPKHVLGFRLRDLQILFRDRYGGPLPERGARVDLIVLLHHVARLGDVHAFDGFRARWYPWLGDDEHARLIAMTREKPLYWDADELAEELELDFATRKRLVITTIGATDFPKRWRMRQRKKMENERKRAKRAKAGVTPHATSAAQAKPWHDLGMSRATYYRRQREKRQALCPTETRETDSAAAARVLVVSESPPTGAPTRRESRAAT